MKTIEVKLSGKVYEIALDDGFYDYIKADIDKLNNCDNQLKELLNLMFSCKNTIYEQEKQIKTLLNQIERTENENNKHND